ncbi:MFS transporter [Tistrella mobilis]|uniref:MFS transporter n=1 Tax=Tistrella mobilis TaxID=171437 RepID=UPI0035585B27
MSAASPLPRQPGFGLAAWTVVIIGFLSLGLAFSTRAALGLAMPVWEQAEGWSRTEVSNAGALALVVMALLAPTAGLLTDSHGPRRLLGAGLVMVAAAAGLISLADGPVMLILAFSVVGGIGFGAVATHVVATAVALMVPAARRGFATGIATAGATAGQLALVPILSVWMTADDWRTGFIGLALAAGVAAVAALVLLPRARAAAAVPGGAAPAAEPMGRRIGFLATNPVFHALFWSFFICGITTSGVIEVHLMPYAALCGFPPLPSATAYGVLCAVNLGGMILAGHLGDRIDRGRLLAVIYAGRAAALVLLVFIGDDYGLLLIFAVLFGLFDYSTVAPTAGLVADRLGLHRMGLAMGLLSAGHSLGAALGAWAGGRIFAATGDYAGLWYGAAALSGVAVLIVLTLARPRGRDLRPGRAALAA